MRATTIENGHGVVETAGGRVGSAQRVERGGVGSVAGLANARRNFDGALPGAKKYLAVPPGTRRPYEIKQHGPYTVVQSNEALTVFGNQMRPNK